MAFVLSRRVGEALEVQGVLIEISKITESTVILRITADESLRVRYKEFTRHAKRDADSSAQDRASLARIRKDRKRGPHSTRGRGLHADTVDQQSGDDASD